MTALGQAIHLTGPNKPIFWAVLTMMKFAAGMAIFAATSIRHLLVIYDRMANQKVLEVKRRFRAAEERRAAREVKVGPRAPKKFRRAFTEQLLARLLAKLVMLAGSAAAALFLGADQGIVLWSASLLGVLTISLTLWG